MKERNLIRILRYGMGIISLILAIGISIIMENFNVIFKNIHEVLIIIILYILIISLVFFLVLSAVLIGRCETFLNENYPKKKGGGE